MKKTLIALAALAATGAFAQSTVTMYGRADVGYANSITKTTSAATGGVETEANNNGITSHNSVSSFWGIKGSEDLGGGMKANFIFEADLFPATGRTGYSGADSGYNAAATTGLQATSAGSFDRTSLLGVSGGFGSIMLGKDYTPTFKLIGASDLFGLSRLSVVGLAAGIPTAGLPASAVGSSSMGSTVARQVIYTTPNFGGFTGTVAVGNNNRSDSANDTTSKDTHLSGTYANGPLFVGLGLGRNEAVSGATGAASAKGEQSALTASYDFGVVKLVGGYTTAKYTPNTSAAPSYTATETNLGVAVPMGNVTLLAQVGRNTITSDGATTAASIDANGNDWVIGADYNLSKRTALFVKTGVINKLSGTAAGADYSNKTTETNLGVKHTF